jgi:ABC-type multidrug transport system fused ATPase/permease subunit
VDYFTWKDMVEGKTCFPEFEKYLERGSLSVYHEDSLFDYRSFIGILIVFIGAFFIFCRNPDNYDFLILGTLIFFFGFLLLIVSLLMSKSKQKLYKYQGLSRHRISEAIMFIDALLPQPSVFESTEPNHENAIFSSQEMISKRDSFLLFLKATKGLVTWPSELINRLEGELQNNQKNLPFCVATSVIVFIILVVINYFLLMSGNLLIVVLGFLLFISCTIEWPLAVVIITLKNRHVFKGEWILDVRKSDSIGLEESLLEIFSLLGSYFPFPLRFFVVKEYPQLTYTGRMKPSKSLIQLREAVLYPTNSAANTTC